MSTVLSERETLLAGWVNNGSADLRAHVATHGLLRLPQSYDSRFSAEVSALLEQSGLSGRGGASFPSARKLQAVRSSGRPPVLVVNAMESEPLSQKDSVLLSCAPHLVLDGAQVAALACGASRVVVCIPEDREQCMVSLRRALAERSTDLLPVPVETPSAPGGYVAGEESALVSWLERGNATPMFRLDKSVPLSIGRQPVLVHNAETLAQLALLSRHGAGWYRQRGRPDAPGTCLVTLSGTVSGPGVYEVELGTPLDSIVGLAGPERPIIAVLVGGYGGVWVGADALHLGYCNQDLYRVGATMGVGVLLAIDDTVCGLGESARIARYMAAQSAGQCGPCVFGLPALAADIELLAGGRARAHDVQRLHARLTAIYGRGACRHPDGVVRMLNSALSVFAHDVHAHVNESRCLAGGVRGPAPA